MNMLSNYHFIFITIRTNDIVEDHLLCYEAMHICKGDYMTFLKESVTV